MPPRWQAGISRLSALTRPTPSASSRIHVCVGFVVFMPFWAFRFEGIWQGLPARAIGLRHTPADVLRVRNGFQVGRPHTGSGPAQVVHVVAFRNRPFFPDVRLSVRSDRLPVHPEIPVPRTDIFTHPYPTFAGFVYFIPESDLWVRAWSSHRNNGSTTLPLGTRFYFCEVSFPQVTTVKIRWRGVPGQSG